MQGGVDCNAAGAAMSHAMQHAMAHAAAGGGAAMAMQDHHGEMMEGMEDEAWAHDFAMNPHMHHHHHHQHHQHHNHHHFQHPMAHHADPMAQMGGGDDWAAQMGSQHDAAGGQAVVHEDALAEAMADAEMQGAFAEAEAEGQAAEGTGDWLEQFQEQDGREEGEEWAEDFNTEEVKVYGVDGEQPPSVAEKNANSQFHGLMRDIEQGDVVIEESARPAGEVADDQAMEAAMAAAEEAGAAGADEAWANDYEGDAQEAAMRSAWESAQAEGETGEDFVNEMMARERAMAAEHGAMAAAREGEQGEDWEEEFNDNDEYTNEFFGEGDEWLKEYETMSKRAADAQNVTDYPFETNNPYLFHDDPFTEGLEMQAAGTLAEAVLAFEAACQKDATNVEYWQFLGTTQAENEKDTLAIVALNNAIKLCPHNLHALSALAVCHTNESNHGFAMKALRDWIAANDKYEGVAEAVGSLPVEAEEDLQDHYAAEYLFVDTTQHKQVCAMYEAALEIDPADLELHKALGVLHNLSNQYDRAAENFRNALKVAPEDENLWNKLGATLANGNRPREAIEAYNRALDISPGFVRAQYNLGIAYSNCGDHINAARQFIRAIVMQQGGINPPEDSAQPPRSTREVWDVLRMTLNLMDRTELVDVTWQHDVRPFLDEFGLQDLKM